MKGSSPIARAWAALLLAGIAVQLVMILGPFPQNTVDTPGMQALYDGVLLGAAVLVGIRVVVRPRERLAWALIAVRSRAVHDRAARQNVTVQPSWRACSAV